MCRDQSGHGRMPVTHVAGLPPAQRDRDLEWYVLVIDRRYGVATAKLDRLFGRL
jgi:hypothetical protein